MYGQVYATNLLVQPGDHVQVGQDSITVVDSESFWIDGYFEETHLGSIQEGDPAMIKLMGYSQIGRAHVASIARGRLMMEFVRRPSERCSRLGLFGRTVRIR